MMPRSRSIIAVLLGAFGAVAVASAAPKATQNIADIAMATPNLSTLVKALQAADMVGDLQGPGPLTVFAPTDQAFAKIPPDQLNALLQDKTRLRQVLSNHVVSGDLTADKLKSGMSLKPLAGQALPVSTMGGAVHVGEAKVVKANIAASNGVIHEIDTVLMPQ